MLDHALLEFAARIPMHHKMPASGTGKYILKKIAEKYLPHDVLYRKKMGFAIPAVHWFRGELKEFTREHLLTPDARTRTLFRPEVVSELFRQHTEAGRDHSFRLYPMLCLEIWLRHAGLEP
ncbi:Asparagine synthetase [glutamine-hydrolyzing] 1 [compost metagenome]